MSPFTPLFVCERELADWAVPDSLLHEVAFDLTAALVWYHVCFMPLRAPDVQQGLTAAGGKVAGPDLSQHVNLSDSVFLRRQLCVAWSHT